MNTQINENILDVESGLNKTKLLNSNLKVNLFEFSKQLNIFCSNLDDQTASKFYETFCTQNKILNNEIILIEDIIILWLEVIENSYRLKQDTENL